MPQPLDNVTVIQQINFAERVHQDQQYHPQWTKLKTAEDHRRLRAELRSRTVPASATSRTGVRLYGYNYSERESRPGGRVVVKA